MPRPPLDLDRWRSFIEDCIIRKKYTLDHTRGLLQDQGANVSTRTLGRVLAQWDVSTKPRYVDTPALRASIETMFYQWRLTDKEMVELLEEDGITIGLQPLARLRKKMGLNKRTMAWQEGELEARMTEVLQQEYNDGSIEDSSRANLYAFIRNKYRDHPIIGRDRLYKIASELNPKGQSRRQKKTKSRRETLIANGQNHQSLDPALRDMTELA